MRANLVSKNGCVYLHDADVNGDIIALTATEAMWLSSFLQQHLTSELVVQLRLAAQHANKALETNGPMEQTFELKRG